MKSFIYKHITLILMLTFVLLLVLIIPFVYHLGLRGHSVGQGIGLIIGLGYIGLVRLAIRSRDKQVFRDMALMGQTDPVWNYDEMHEMVFQFFMKFQAAYCMGSFDSIKDDVTPNLIQQYKKDFGWLVLAKLTPYREMIAIDEIRFLSDHTDADHDKERFSALVKGKMISYNISAKPGAGALPEDAKPSRYSNIFFFQRKGTKWLLDKVETDPGMHEILNAE